MGGDGPKYSCPQANLEGSTGAVQGSGVEVTWVRVSGRCGHQGNGQCTGLEDTEPTPPTTSPRLPAPGVRVPRGNLGPPLLWPCASWCEGKESHPQAPAGQPRSTPPLAAPATTEPPLQGCSWNPSAESRPNISAWPVSWDRGSLGSQPRRDRGGVEGTAACRSPHGPEHTQHPALTAGKSPVPLA